MASIRAGAVAKAAWWFVAVAVVACGGAAENTEGDGDSDQGAGAGGGTDSGGGGTDSGAGGATDSGAGGGSDSGAGGGSDPCAGDGTASEECPRPLESFCDHNDCAPTYDELLETAQTWHVSCDEPAPEFGTMDYGYEYGSCGSGGYYIIHLLGQVSYAYSFDAEENFIGVSVFNSTGDPNYHYGPGFGCADRTSEFSTCP